MKAARPSIALVNLNSLPGLRVPPLFPIGPAYLSSYLEHQGIRTRIIDFVHEPEQLDEPRALEEGFDYLGFSIRSMDSLELNGHGLLPRYAEVIERFTEVAKAANPATKVVLGGTAFSQYHEVLGEELSFDFGIVGPAEESLGHALMEPNDDLVGGRVLRGRSLSSSSSQHVPLLLDRELLSAYQVAGADEIGLQRTRGGCPLRCTYCAYGAIEQTSMQSWEDRRLAVDIVQMYEQGVRRFFVTDSVFNWGRRRARDFCKLLLELGLDDLRWSAYFLPTTDTELLDLLEPSGCRQLIVSFDSFDERMLKIMRKPFDMAHVRNFLDEVRQRELPLGAVLLFGGPGEDRKSALTSCRFANSELEAHELFYSFGIRLQPGSALARNHGLSQRDLLPLTFVDFPESLFDDVANSLESRFMDFMRFHRMITWRQGYLDMQRVDWRHDDHSISLLRKEPP